MTENTPPAIEAPAEVLAEKPSRLRNFTLNHPKITNAAKLTAAGLGIVAVTRAVTNAQHNKDKLSEALDHAHEAGDALTDAVTIPDES